jgi:hypothetical protein
MTTTFVSTDQAVLNAIVAWLAPAFPDATVSARWPSGTNLPPLALTVIPAGDRQDDVLTPSVIDAAIVHTTVTPRITAPAAVDTPTVAALLTACKASYEAHRVDLTAHVAADTTNSLAAVPNAVDFGTSLALLAAFCGPTGTTGVLNPHFLNATAHANAELVQSAQAVLALAQDTPTYPPVALVASLCFAAEAVRTALHKHYAARLYTCLLHACVLPLQLDVWATYNAVRDDAMARLDVRLNGDPMGVAEGPGAPGLLLSLGDGFSAFADTWWDQPGRNDTADAVQTSEFRSTYKGTASFNLTVRIQGSRMTQIVFKATGSEQSPPPTTMAADTITVATAANADGYTVTLS